MNPRVSVIVPNYNHAPFLRQRLDSVCRQTIRDIEIILLDDCSTDSSRKILQEYAADDDRIRLAFNEKNTGSTFHQWNKGVALARAPIVWIAESDDYAELNFLETLLPLMEADGEVGIAFCQSMIVDESGRSINSFQENYAFIFSERAERWTKSFCVEGLEECRNYLVFTNTIPNASGALMRKSVYEKAGGADPSMKLNGDWFFYAKMLMHSNLCYVPEMMNYFRLHTQTQRHSAKSGAGVYHEILITVGYIKEHAQVPDATYKKSMQKIGGWWAGSLFFQKRDKNYFKDNLKLFFIFSRYNKLLGLAIIGVAIKKKTKWILMKLGLFKPVKKRLVKWFPGKFYKHEY